MNNTYHSPTGNNRNDSYDTSRASGENEAIQPDPSAFLHAAQDQSGAAGVDPTLEYDDQLDDDYRAVLQNIAASRQRKTADTGALNADAVKRAQSARNDRADEFQVRISDEAFASLERMEPEAAPPAKPAPAPVPAAPVTERRRPRRKRRRFRLLKALLLVAMVIGVSFYLSSIILNAVYDLFGLQKEDIEIEVDIPQGSSVVEIAEILSERGVIEEPLIFRVYSRVKGADDSYQYGTYTMNQKMSYDEIIRMLQVRVPRKDVVNVTIPEGLTAYEIAQLLEENNVCDADEFIEIVRTANIQHPLIPNVGAGKYRYFRLEGYLFPDTYQFYIDEAASSCVRRFLDNFQQKFENELTLAMNDTDYSLDQILTLASIIQAESSHTDNMTLVSSVFHNRLNAPDIFPQLQSDPTISYVTDNILPMLDVRDEGYYSAYSTYMCHGLPVGPINSPGIAAIRAAIYPASSNYYFFVTDREGNFYYAATDAEHEVNKQKAGIGS